MKLLDALAEVVESQQLSHIKARNVGELVRLVHFAFSDDEEIAFLSEITIEELVPLLEAWCRQQRFEMGTIQ